MHKSTDVVKFHPCQYGRYIPNLEWETFPAQNGRHISCLKWEIHSWPRMGDIFPAQNGRHIHGLEWETHSLPRMGDIPCLKWEIHSLPKMGDTFPAQNGRHISCQVWEYFHTLTGWGLGVVVKHSTSVCQAVGAKAVSSILFPMCQKSIFGHI